MPEALVSNLVDLIADKQVADHAKPEAYIGLEHIPERAIRIEKVGTTETIRGMCVHYREGDILFGKLRPNLRRASSHLSTAWDRQRYSCFVPRPA
jgi:type I restriction enzyme S subunit